MIDKLEVIQLESSTRCNARCSMCPHSFMSRFHGDMSDEMFHKILDQGMDMGVRQFLLFLNGEPFMFPKFWTWNEELQNRNLITSIYTNASLISQKVIDQLKGFHNIASLNVSFHGGTPETYQKVMGLKWESIRKKVEYLIQECPHLNIKIQMVEFEDNKGTVEEFKKLWGARAQVVHLWNWAGAIKDPRIDRDMRKPMRPCQRALHHLTPLWDGHVALCCMDYNGEHILGDLNKEDLKTIWERNQPFRDRQKRHDFVGMELCNHCNVCRVER